MNKRGRPPLPPESRRTAVRVVFYASSDDLREMREYAAYHAETIQQVTRRCWKKLITHARETGKLDFSGAAKNT